MFGYIRPLKDELKVSEYEQYKSCYCGLCWALKNEYGIKSRFLLTYDFTFLAMLLWAGNEQPELFSKRCPASPLSKKCACTASPALIRCAGYSVILSWWKLQDTIDDDGLFRSIGARILKLVYYRPYKKASRFYPAYEAVVKAQLALLKKTESQKASTLDACADKFAVMTAALAADEQNTVVIRPLEQLLYHTGRFIYILDAIDDLPKDSATGRFNPLRQRFSLDNGQLSVQDKTELITTLNHSIRMISSAFELLPVNSWTSIIKNIIYLGMPEVMTRVLDGSWNKQQSKRK